MHNSCLSLPPPHASRKFSDAAECLELIGSRNAAAQRYRTALLHPALTAPADILLRLATLASAGGDDVGAQVRTVISPMVSARSASSPLTRAEPSPGHCQPLSRCQCHMCRSAINRRRARISCRHPAMPCCRRQRSTPRKDVRWSCCRRRERCQWRHRRPSLRQRHRCDRHRAWHCHGACCERAKEAEATRPLCRRPTLAGEPLEGIA